MKPNDALLFDAVRTHSTRSRGMVPSVVLYRYPDGSEATFTIPLEWRQPAPVPKTSPMEESILEVLSSLRPDEVMTGEEIAKESGYASGGKFRQTLSRMVQEGVLVNKDPGYALVPPPE